LEFPTGSLTGPVTIEQPVSQIHTRKTFFGRLTAVIAASALMPRVFANAANRSISQSFGESSFKLKPDNRAVARDADSI